MTERIKLTEDDIQLLKDAGWCEQESQSCDWKRVEQIEKQILENQEFCEKFQNDENWIKNTKEFAVLVKKNQELEQKCSDYDIQELSEKAEKYDACGNLIDQVNKLLSRCSRMENETKRDKAIISQTLDENKQLKAKLMDMKFLKDKWENESIQLKEDIINLENHYVLSVNEITNLKQKLEKIEELIKQITDNPKENPCNAWVIKELKEILEMKE